MEGFLGGDPCGQSMDRGMGGAQLSRWYWDQSRQCCLPFSYCGQKGTQNNFLTKQDCEQTCFEIDNPCALGEPQMISPNEVRFCSISNPLTCAPSYWCHYGATEQTTLCCPGRVEPQDVCQQPMAQGTGNGQLFRWYYNSVSQCCLQFTYRGREGNQNNFLSREECESQCVSINVCPYGEPQKGLTGGRPILCTFNGTECAPNHFCHLGLVPDENQCCPGEPTNPAACQGLPPQEGIAGPTGSQPTERWFYEVTTMSCKPFTFDGRKGNQNNFLSEADCAATCQVFVNPCSLPISMPPQQCSVDNPNTCSGGSYCHIGGSPTTTICCPSEGDPCQLPLNCGMGNEALNRFYFNQQTGQCQPFIYLGTKGNQNNFLSQQMCEASCSINPCAEGNPFIGVDGRTQTCSASQSLNMCPSSYWCHIGADTTTTVCCPGASQNSCNLPMSTGEGNANLERYYFDQSSKTCRQFIYNGLKGNQNNFLTLRSCQLACQPLDNPCIGQPATTPSGQVLFCSATNKDTCPVNFWCHLGATPETTVCCPGATNPCSVPLAPGTGNAGLARWYYNPDDRQCVPFQYNGKRGNQNNFLSQPECERTCPVFKNPCIDENVEKDIKSGAPKECDPMMKEGCSNGFFCLAGDTSLIRQSFCCKIISISNVCFGGQEPFKIANRITQCKSNNDCPIGTHYCHIGAEKRANVCCKKQGSPCEQQLMIGIGDSKLPRFYYSEVEDRCLAFNYSGLAGNENNFATKAQCEIICPGFRDFCPHGKPLLNKGKPTLCGIDTACQKGFVCHVTKKETKSVCCPDPAAFCLLPREIGPCRGAEKRYFYNRQTGICEKFGGCLGNLNNFESLESCTEVCCDKGYTY
uniref:BPTI/Kunitz inhibitor domain-containing protein n=1 Tax=Panagrolaimus sp. ES5 TaxID=591445 RepID=A0AC34F1S9_9BILA